MVNVYSGYGCGQVKKENRSRVVVAKPIVKVEPFVQVRNSLPFGNVFTARKTNKWVNMNPNASESRRAESREEKVETELTMENIKTINLRLAS
jgi:hypothetical protein